MSFPRNINLENIVYHVFRQLWLVLGVKLMEINSILFSKYIYSNVPNVLTIQLWLASHNVPSDIFWQCEKTSKFQISKQEPATT